MTLLDECARRLLRASSIGVIKHILKDYDKAKEGKYKTALKKIAALDDDEYQKWVYTDIADDALMEEDGDAS